VQPKAVKLPNFRTIHGETVQDDWFYLRDREHPQTIPYLEAENRYTELLMAPSKALETELYTEMVGRIMETDESVPYRMGAFEYYTRTEKGRQYPILCRRGIQGVTGEILLDCNALAEGHEYFSMAFDLMSPDGKTLAYATDTDGSEVYTLRFHALPNQDLPDTVTGVYYSGGMSLA
jgi:oligopeptidase B